MNEFPYMPEQGSTHIVCVNLVSVGGLPTLTVGNKNSRNFVKSLGIEETTVVDAMVANRQSFIWVKAQASWSGKNVMWTILEDTSTMISRISAGKAACLASYYEED